MNEGSNSAHEELNTREIKLKQILDKWQWDIYTDFRDGMAWESHSVEALNAIGERLENIMMRKELVPYVATIWDDDIVQYTKDSMANIRRFIYSYVNWDIDLTDNLSNEHINRLQDVYLRIENIIEYIDMSMDSLDHSDPRFTLLVDMQTMIVFMKHFMDAYMDSPISDKEQQALNSDRWVLFEAVDDLQWWTYREWSIIDSKLTELYDENRAVMSHKDMLSMLFFFDRYGSLMASMKDLYGILKLLNNLSIEEVTSAKYKKHLAEITVDYNDTKASFKQTYWLLEDSHKKSSRYDPSIDNIFLVLYECACKDIRKAMKRVQSQSENK